VRRVSVLMPCRDASRHLPAAIASVRRQTFEDYEVVAIDDGSVDGTFDLLRAWADDDDRVRVIRREPRGLVPALATGLSFIHAPLVARMDADDVASATRLAKQVARLDADPHLAACGTGVRYFPPDAVRDGARRYEEWINGLTTPAEIARDIFVECPIAHPTLMIRRGILDGIGGYRELGWPEDYDLVLRLWAAGYRMAKVPEVLLAWRESPDRASRTDARYAEVEFRRIKIFFLKRTLLAGDRDAIVWGAGPVGKAFARDLAEAGTRILAFVDVAPSKIGQEIHGAPVVAPDAVSGLVGRRRGPDAEPDLRPGTPLVLAAVGQPGARAEIRAECLRQGLVEGEDFIAVA
jgi:glycosyltransferase involved in cell wall biosynthesis